MSNSDRLLLRVGGKVAVVELYKTEAPETVTAIRGNLPISFPIMTHAKFSGEEVAFPIKSIGDLPAENEKWDSTPGEIAYFRPSQMIVVYYGRVKTITPGSTFGKIVDGLDSMYSTFRETWFRSDIPVSLEAMED